MTVLLRWTEETSAAVEAAELHDALAAIVPSRAEGAVIAELSAEGAEITVVVGDPTGTVLVYFPPSYFELATGSLLSVGNDARNDRSQPPLTAFYFGHHTEFPRWSVVPYHLGEEALRQFCQEPATAPSVIAWEPD
jgi:hypothetical protein